MSRSAQRPEGPARRAPEEEPTSRLERSLDSLATRTVLSVLILLSVLPAEVFPLADRFWFLFLAVFSIELVARVLVILRDRRRLRLKLREIPLLALDFLAIVSFLPVLAGDLRILRLARLLLLVGYWRGFFRELWTLVARPERRYQIVLVLSLGAILAFGSAVVMMQIGTQPELGTGDGDPERPTFQDILWWSFRQIQDPGNLVPSLEDPRLVTISLLLTFSGLLLFSFFIGIGTNLVAELVERSRGQPLGLHDHTVILGRTPYTGILLRELSDAYRKNSRTYRCALMADQEDPGDSLRHVHYRRGDPARTTDLERVNIGHAKRVIAVGNDSRDPDASVISAILATRQRNPRVSLYPDLEHERNFPAALAAGGPATHLVGSGSMLGYYVAQNVAYPGVYRLYRHLLRTSAGCEIYTHVFSEQEREALPTTRGWPDPAWIDRLAKGHTTTLLGFLVGEKPDDPLDSDNYQVVLNPLRTGARQEATGSDGRDSELRSVLRGELRGLIGLAPGYSNLADLGRHLLEMPMPPDGETETWPGDQTPGAFEALRLLPPRPKIERVLILGAGPRVPRTVMELVGFFRHLEITVLAGTREPHDLAVHDIHTMLSEAFSKAPERQAEDAAIRIRLATGDLAATITVMVADWTHGHLLEEAGAVTLEQADVILFLPSRDIAEDRDGRIALDCLHLADLERSGKVAFKAGVHVLALVRDPAKGDLLERRLVEMRDHGRAGRKTGLEADVRYTVISSERSRHRFLMQSVFVRGLNAIYLSLLSSRGQYLSRLLPGEGGLKPEGAFNPADLARYLLERRGLLLIGYERRGDGGGFEVVVDPRSLGPGQTVRWSDVNALYVMGEGPDVAALAS